MLRFEQTLLDHCHEALVAEVCKATTNARSKTITDGRCYFTAQHPLGIEEIPPGICWSNLERILSAVDVPVAASCLSDNEATDGPS